jgi:flagellar biogenesis protein FliO
MTRTQAIAIAAWIVFAPVAQAGDEIGASANMGKPLKLQSSEPENEPPKESSKPTDVVEQWTALATRVQPGAHGAELTEPPPLNSTSLSTINKSAPRTLARRDTGSTEGVSSPLDAFRAAPARSLLPLGVTIAAIAVLALAFRKWSPNRSRPGGGRVIQVLSRHALSNKHSLCLVRIGEGLVLLGVTPERIATLIEIRDAEEVSRILGTTRSAQGESFSTTLRGLARLPSPADEPDNDIEPVRALPAAKLSSAGATVRDLVSRVRQFSGEAAIPHSV